MSGFHRYGIALLLTAVALSFALLGEDAWGGAMPFSFFLGAVMISSWVGGLGPGLLATVLGSVSADYFTMIPLESQGFDLSHAVQISTFASVSLVISSLNGSRRRAIAALDRERAQLEIRVAERTAALANTNADLQAAQQEQQVLVHDLAERVKELTVVTIVGRLLNEPTPPASLLSRVVAQLPAAWQYPEVAEARIAAGPFDARTARFHSTPWIQRAELHTSLGKGALEIVYREARPDAGEGPFLAEERRLIDLLAGMLQVYFERVHAEAQAEEARREAQDANAAKDQFLATLSDELRSPLSVMLGWTQMLRSARMPADVIARGFDVLERSVRLQARLIEDLLDVSRIVTGRLNIDKCRIDLAGIAGAVVDEARPAAQAKRIALTARTVSELLLDADPHRIQQVISNLLTNALKFTPEHGAIDLLVEQSDDQAFVVVRDTGIGIPAELLPRIFNRFEQGDQSMTRRFGGLGLGLAIVKHFVELHGGRVTANSDGPGCGSTFTIALPLSTPAPTLDLPPTRDA